MRAIAEIATLTRRPTRTVSDCAGFVESTECLLDTLPITGQDDQQKQRVDRGTCQRAVCVVNDERLMLGAGHLLAGLFGAPEVRPLSSVDFRLQIPRRLALSAEDRMPPHRRNNMNEIGNVIDLNAAHKRWR